MQLVHHAGSGPRLLPKELSSECLHKFCGLLHTCLQQSASRNGLHVHSHTKWMFNRMCRLRGQCPTQGASTGNGTQLVMSRILLQHAMQWSSLESLARKRVCRSLSSRPVHAHQQSKRSVRYSMSAAMGGSNRYVPWKARRRSACKSFVFISHPDGS